LLPVRNMSLIMIRDGICPFFWSRFEMILDLFPSSKMLTELLDTAANKEVKDCQATFCARNMMREAK
jgi:hypothetical protein